MTTLQILVSLVYMAILGRLKVMHFERLSWSMAKQVNNPSSSGPDACCAALLLLGSAELTGLLCMQVFPLAFFWWLYVVSGVTALRFLTVPMYR